MNILDIIHVFYAIVGISSNSTLLTVIILTRSNSGLKSFALILFNVAVFDTIEIMTEVYLEPRLIVYDEYIIFIYHGYCRLVRNLHKSLKRVHTSDHGAQFCYLIHTVMLHQIFFSILLTAYSFWFRYSILSKPASSVFTVQMIVFSLIAPNAVPMCWCFFTINLSDYTDYILECLYPTMDVNTTTHKSVSLYDSHASVTVSWASTMPFIVYTFIVVIRRRTLGKLASLADSMSEKTKMMHQSLIRALTCHAILPVTICFGISAFFVQAAGWHGEILDSMMFVFTCIPAVFDPFLVLYFVKPYRRCILNSLHRATKISSQSAPSTPRS